jgi:predicted nuclease of restriction endonuclease-like (RecB) superfamily
LFYEVECIRGNWSVRELKRQISSLYYERSGLSYDKKKLAALVDQNAEVTEPNMVIRNPYVFEFVGLKPQEVMSESHLEEQLITKLEDFLLELGNGFCFESRQKRILIGDEYFFIDLVFYHRILKCHILIELKLEQFTHENIGQLNTYVSWYKKNMMKPGDNPPIGLLLCTDKNHALVEYALAGLDNNLFVSKYLLELPKKEDLQAFVEEQVKEIGSTENESKDFTNLLYWSFMVHPLGPHGTPAVHSFHSLRSFPLVAPFSRACPIPGRPKPYPAITAAHPYGVSGVSAANETWSEDCQ